MNCFVKLFFLFCVSFSFAQLPEGFVYAKEVIPDLDVDLRYYSSNNFVGKPVEGYLTNKLILTKQAALALKQVQEELQSHNLCLLVFDGYRPQQAVNHFMSWAKDLNDTINKHRFYPDVAKQHLFKEEYIATRSGHSKGSTVDLTIIDGNTGQPLDMGSNFDFFGEASWVNYSHITEKQKANRKLLQTVMLKHGFRNYPKEWWHFTLRKEPFPATYFDFPVK
ncbi:M15 family metallopeptidase [Aestuariibaculum marinum]|uniref:D-alanyl-D-alanine dipeptidase n=1 Tax=Aestuariibaculum marinum TaxID=2683592 RepID=A0A8J6U7R9_9FLAO|nr:M15 family metallopeptidase [Aestuariibaculum marinum]MBD0825419.1 M15 family metallopeptidase [Aestuariibaculum marinum]